MFKAFLRNTSVSLGGGPLLRAAFLGWVASASALRLGASSRCKIPAAPSLVWAWPAAPSWVWAWPAMASVSPATASLRVIRRPTWGFHCFSCSWLLLARFASRLPLEQLSVVVYPPRRGALSGPARSHWRYLGRFLLFENADKVFVRWLLRHSSRSVSWDRHPHWLRWWVPTAPGSPFTKDALSCSLPRFVSVPGRVGESDLSILWLDSWIG